jgi:hypothetical protein
MATERKIPEIGEEVHLPGLSAQPLMLAVGTTIMLLGVTQPNPIFFIVGLVVFGITLFLWIRDAVAEYKALPESHGDHGHDDHAHADEHAAAPDAH